MAAAREHFLKTDNKHLFRTQCRLKCCNSCTYCTQAFPKERIKSWASRLSYSKKSQIKICERCFLCQLSCVQPVASVKNTAQNLPVGARLQAFWQIWLDLGASPKEVQILKEGYTLPFRIRPKLTRSPTVISCYANPHRNSYLLEALHRLINNKCCRTGTKPNLVGVLQLTIFSPKSQQVETNIRPKQSESFSQGGEIQNGDTGNHQDIPPNKGSGLPP